MERVKPRLNVAVHNARFGELTPAQLYGILRLRSAVFVVEQACIYLDLDGRDQEPSTTHWWCEDGDGRVVATLRLLRTPRFEGSEIGRVATAPDRRREGLATQLIRHALRVAPRPTRANAQSQLAGWYGQFGFEVAGDEFVEDGIPHVPMTLR